MGIFNEMKTISLAADSPIADCIRKAAIHKYMVLMNPSKDMLYSVYDRFSDIFIFTFVDCEKADECPDYSWMRELNSNYVVMPIYIGNLKKECHASAIDQIIKNSLGEQCHRVNQE